jgi:biopolymer transport protein ExbD
MAFKSSRLTHRGQPLGEINMIPLIDVMLVLLIVFMVTAPLLTHAVKIELPKASSQPNRVTPNLIQLGIRESGEYLWKGAPVSLEKLGELMKAAAAREPQPELQIHADANTPYQAIAKAMAWASGAGLSKIGFVSDPERLSPR